MDSSLNSILLLQTAFKHANRQFYRRGCGYWSRFTKLQTWINKTMGSREVKKQPAGLNYDDQALKWSSSAPNVDREEVTFFLVTWIL